VDWFIAEESSGHDVEDKVFRYVECAAPSPLGRRRWVRLLNKVMMYKSATPVKLGKE
jgi:hypothetical protein